MNDLDKRIAALKGWRDFEWPTAAGFQVVAPAGTVQLLGQWWSESLSMALDLADELTDAGFEVTIATWNPGDGRRSRVRVAKREGPEPWEWTVEGLGTREEMICRAWIAAREFVVGPPGG